MKEEIRPKFGGVYETPDGSFLLYMPDCVRIFKAFRVEEDCFVDQEITYHESTVVQEAVEFSVRKHGYDLVMTVNSQTFHYKIFCSANNAVIENSKDIELGLISRDREIPSARDLKFQPSSNDRTQVSPGVWVNRK